MRIIIILMLAIGLGACTTVKKARKIDTQQEKINTLARINNIKSNDTAYSPSLRCFGNLINQQIAEGKKPALIKKLFLSINDIHDKTAKVYGEKSTALSDIVLHAVSKMNLLNIYDHDASVAASRTNYISNEHPMHPSIKSNPLAINSLPVGIIKPSHYTISGALTQYDEISRDSLDVDINLVGYSNRVSRTDVGIDLRLIYSPMGVVVLPDDRDRRYMRSVSTSLTNRLISIKHDGEVFKLIDSEDYGTSLYYSINDPKYYAVRELVERAVLDMFANLFNENWERHCSVETEFMGKR